MRQRDLQILDSLDKFRCLTSSQIASLHFSNNANPKISCNRVLKRLTDTGYVTRNTNRSFQDYIYFLNPAPIKKDSQKIDHYLTIADGYLSCLSYGNVDRYDVEEKIIGTKFRADALCLWMDNYWFFEFQCSTYSAGDLHKKIGLYLDFYHSNEWKDLLGISTFPNVLIIGKTNLKFDPSEYPFKVTQIKSFADLELSIKAYQSRKLDRIRKEVKEVKQPRKANMESNDCSLLKRKTSDSPKLGVENFSPYSGESNNGKITFKLN